MRRKPARAAALAVVLIAGTSSATRAADPKPVPGKDPGGIAVALVSAGLDYNDPAIAPRLARDGEGELIGWDLIDDDPHPYAPAASASPSAAPDGSALARQLASRDGVRIVPVRAAPARPDSLARSLDFTAQTPARIAIVTASSPAEAEWQPFADAALRHPQLLLVVAAGDQGADLDASEVFPAVLAIPNMLVVTARPAAAGPTASSPNQGKAAIDVVVEGEGASRASTWAAVALVQSLAECHAALLSRAGSGEQLKSAILGALGRKGEAHGPVLVAPCLPAKPNKAPEPALRGAVR